MIDSETCWRAVQQKDAALEGKFFYGVITTGVFCRPGCAGRTPRRENVRFYPTTAAAEADGLRACKRCRPLGPKPAAAREIQTYIDEHLDEPASLKLAELSRHFHLSAFHLQRTFKAAVGVTPRQYAEARRLAALKKGLRRAPTVTTAIYNAGFGSSSSVYSGADAHLGMTPKQYRSGGAAVEVSYATVETPLGLAMIGATDRGLCFLEFGDSEDDLLDALKREFPSAQVTPMIAPYPPEFASWADGLRGLLAAPARVDLHGTAFQLKVWRYLQTIPAGSVQTYAEVAQAIGQPQAVRAVASACAANRVGLAVPCHRVIRGDGGLGGYRWGLERKRALLEAERAGLLRANT